MGILFSLYSMFVQTVKKNFVPRLLTTCRSYICSDEGVLYLQLYDRRDLGDHGVDVGAIR